MYYRTRTSDSIRRFCKKGISVMNLPVEELQNGNPNERNRTILIVVCLLLVALLSATVIAGYASSPESQAKVISSLDQKKTTVLELTAATTATSVAISLLPGDAATPIADQMADLSQYFLLILCAVYLEKYMVTIMGLVSFRFLVPAAMAFLIYHILRKSERAKTIGAKILVVALVLYFVIPASVLVTGMIEKTYGVSIAETLQAAEDAVNEIRGSTEEEEVIVEEMPEDDAGIWDKIKNLPSDIKDTAQNVVNNVTTLSSEMLVRVQTILNHFIEAIAVMIITSCVIPVLVLIVFIYVAKVLLSGIVPAPGN